VHVLVDVATPQQTEPKPANSTFDVVDTIEAEWLTAKEAAAHLKVKNRTLLLWARQKKIPGYVLSGIKRRVWRFRRADLNARLLVQDGSMLCSVSPSVLTKGDEK